MIQTKWGVIYAPKLGTKSHKTWHKIRNFLNEEGIAFDCIQSENPESNEKVATMMANNGYQTIIIVGGDAALNDVVNGVMKSESANKPAIGIIPNGFGNDFAKYWGFEVGRYKETIRQLIQRRTRKVDIGKASFTTKGTASTRYFIDCVNIGLVASIINIRRKTRRFWGNNTLSYLTTAFLLLFKRMLFKMKFSVNFENIEHNEMTVCIGSARGYGQTPSAVPYNGMLDITAVAHPQLTQVFEGLWLLFTGRFLTHKQVKIWRTRSIRFTEISRAPISFDGRVCRVPVEKLEIEILPEKIDFLIPAT